MAVKSGKKQSTAALSERVEKYFADCTETGRFPSEAGLILALSLSLSEYAELIEGRGTGEVLERARLRRMDWLENRMVTESKSGTGCLNALKQAANGGYSSAVTEDRTLKIIMDGVGEAAAE